MTNTMKSKRTLMAATFAALTLPVLTAHAQFGSVGNLLGKSGGSGGGGDALAQQDAIVRQYVAADKQILIGQSKMAEALGLKQRAAVLAATAESLTDGATKGNLSDADKSVSEASAEIAAKLKENPQLDAASKAKYQEGLASSGKGVLAYLAMRSSFDGFKSSLASASPLVLPKLATGSYVVSTVPTNAKNLVDSMGVAVEYAKNQRIEVPKDATASI